MELLTAYQALNKSTMEVLKSINKVTIHAEVEEVPVIRVRENKFSLTDSIKRYSKAVTAHNLTQYRNVFNTIKLEEAATSWLEELLKIDEREVGSECY